MAIPKNLKLTHEQLDQLVHDDLHIQNSLSQIMNQLCAEREETLLAILAAGVPVNCISLDGPMANFDMKQAATISLGFRFNGCMC